MMDKFYEWAIKFKALKLWNKLDGSYLYAFDDAKGKRWFAAIGAIGMYNEKSWLHIYNDTTGIYGCRMMWNLVNNKEYANFLNSIDSQASQKYVAVHYVNKKEMPEDDLANAEAYIKAHGIKAGGQKFYPRLMKAKYRHIAWPEKSKESYALAAQALQAGVELAKLLENGTIVCGRDMIRVESLDNKAVAPLFICNAAGKMELQKTVQVPCYKEPVTASPRFNDIQLARLKRKKNSGDTWLASIFTIPHPVVNEENFQAFDYDDGKIPYFPLALAFIHGADGHASMAVCREADVKLEDLLKLVEADINKAGRPRKILCYTERTMAFLKNIAKGLDIELQLEKDMPEMDRFIHGLHLRWMQANGVSRDDIEEMLGEGALELLDDMEDVDGLDPVDEPEDRGMPDEVKKQCRELLESMIITADFLRDELGECDAGAWDRNFKQGKKFTTEFMAGFVEDGVLQWLDDHCLGLAIKLCVLYNLPRDIVNAVRDEWIFRLKGGKYSQ
ncbi:MAG: hypothetical protein SPI64_08715 [Anaerovibrio sp.]|nr:hypothetical protein [Selenomonadaceae bacterium]MDY6054185.1 hypothetical protein [Anaerovibrio sp.]